MHPPLNLHIHITTPGGLCLKIVVLHHTLGEVAEFQAQQIKKIYINCHEFCIGCRDNAAEKNLHCGQIHWWCNGISRIVHPVYSYCESCSVWIAIFSSIIYHYSPIRHVTPPFGRDIYVLYENILLVPSTKPGIPCANWPISLA